MNFTAAILLDKSRVVHLEKGAGAAHCCGVVQAGPAVGPGAGLEGSET